MEYDIFLLKLVLSTPTVKYRQPLSHSFIKYDQLNNPVIVNIIKTSFSSFSATHNNTQFMKFVQYTNLTGELSMSVCVCVWALNKLPICE